MKELFWQLLVYLLGYIPATSRQMICRLLFAAIAQQKTDDVLKQLFLLQDELENQIDKASMKREGGIHPKHRLMSYHNFFVSRIKKGEQVLDIGCGYGAVANTLAQYGAHVTALDFDEKQIEQAKNMFPNNRVEYVVGAAPDALPDKHFDCVIFSGSLEHFEHRIELLKKIIELNPKKILIRVPMINRHWHVSLRRELGINFFSDPSHYTEYSEESFSEEMNLAGLKVNYSTVIWGELWAETVPCSA